MDDSNFGYGLEDEINSENHRITPWQPNSVSVMNGAEMNYMNMAYPTYGSNFLHTQPDGPDLSLSPGPQLNQVAQVQIDTTMAFVLDETQPEDSVQTTGNQKSAAAIRSQLYRDKKKEEMETLKNENEQLTREKTTLMNKIEKLKAEKVVSPSLDALFTRLNEQFTAMNTRFDHFENQVNSRLENIGHSIQSLDTKVEGFHNEWMASVSGGNGDDDFIVFYNSIPDV